MIQFWEIKPGEDERFYHLYNTFHLLFKMYNFPPVSLGTIWREGDTLKVAGVTFVGDLRILPAHKAANILTFNWIFKKKPQK